MNTDNCLQYNSSKDSCDVCFPGYAYDNNICSTDCSNSSLVPIYKSGTCNQKQYLIAQIAGDDRSVSYNNTVVLDASITQYPNNSSPLYYTWFCTKDTNPSLSCESNRAVKLNVRSTSPVLVIPPHTYPIDASYNFSVKVESEDGNSSVYYVQLTFKNNTRRVNIEYQRPLYRLCPSDYYTFSVNDEYNVPGRYFVDWNTSYGRIYWNNQSSLTAMTYRFVSDQTPFPALIKVSVNVWSQSDTLMGEASTLFSVNRPATDGSISISPVSGGIPLSTLFQISADGWNDLDGGPLTYAFYYRHNFNVTGPKKILYYTITDYSPANQISTYLPNISPLVIVLSIKDVTGCHSNVSRVFDLTTQIKDAAQTFDDLAAFSKIILQGDQGVSASSIRVLTDELISADELLYCKYNTDLSMSSCLPGAIPNRCQTLFHCSSRGQCSNGRCICDQGYHLADCSMNTTTFNRQVDARMALINFAASYFSNTMDHEKVRAAADLMLELSKRVYLNTNHTYKEILDSLNALFEISSTYSGTSALQMINITAEIISNVLHGVIEASCGLTTNYSIYAVQQSITLLSNLSDLYIKNVNNVSAEIILETSMLLVYVQNLSSSELSNLMINAGKSYPQVQVGTVPNASVLPDYLIANYIYLKSDPLECNDSAPSNFTLIFKNASSLQPVDLSVNVKISYNNETFYWVQCFAPACSQSTDSAGNPTCDCVDISAFNLTTQLSNYHNLSRLYAPKTILITIDPKDPLSSRWSFWVAFSFSLCSLLGFAIVKLTKTDFCFIAKIKRYNEVKKPLDGCYKLFVMILFLNPICNLLIYKSTRISKSLRLLLLYVRASSVLMFSGVFISEATVICFNLWETHTHSIHLQATKPTDVSAPLIACVFLVIPTYTLLLEKLLSSDEEEMTVNSMRTANYM